MDREPRAVEREASRAADDAVVGSATGEVQHRLRELHAAVDTVNHHVAEQLGVNRTDLQCLSLLSLHGAMPAGGVAAAMRLPTGTITTVLDRIERAGLAIRRRSDTDRRKVLVALSADGEGRLTTAYRPLMARSGANIDRYDPDQLAVILDFLATSVTLTSQYVPPANDEPG